jgi:putative ABC transport system substrate-binding protein
LCTFHLFEYEEHYDRSQPTHAMLAGSHPNRSPGNPGPLRSGADSARLRPSGLADSLREDLVLDRRRFLAGAGGVLLAAPLAADAQQADKMARIGYLAFNLAAGDPRIREAFLQGLRDLGYVEGRNLLIEYRDAAGKTERFPALVAELVALKVDVIVAGGGTLAALAAKQATKTLPIVFAAVGNPVAEGLVTSLARPGGNVTGLSLVQQELVGKSLELLKQAVPEVSRVALLLKPDAMPDRAKKDRLNAADVAARALGVRLQVVEARGPEDFDRAFSDMTRARAGALAVLATPVFDSERRRLVDLAAKNRLPTVYSYRSYVEAGGLMSYGPDLADSFRRAATYVDKILKGAKPADLPVEQPSKFELVVNLKTAKALGLTIPPSLLQRADEVIE